MDRPNLAEIAWDGKLTLEQVNSTTKEILETELYQGYTVLFCASAKCPIEVVTAILDRQVEIDGFSLDNTTALMTAAYYHKLDIINLLLRRGANANMFNDAKWNSLHNAAYTGAPYDIIKVLIDAGADPKAENDKSKTPADVARDNKHPDTASLIEQFYLPPTKTANVIA
jgi:ankyrin repeat protein